MGKQAEASSNPIETASFEVHFAANKARAYIS